MASVEKEAQDMIEHSICYLRKAIEARCGSHLEKELLRASQYDSEVKKHRASLGKQLLEKWQTVRHEAEKMKDMVAQEKEETERAIEESLRSSPGRAKRHRKCDELSEAVAVTPGEASTLRIGNLSICVPEQCVTTPTELCAQVIRSDTESWKWVFKLAFTDGQQPLMGVEVFMKMENEDPAKFIDPRKVHIQLMYLPDDNIDNESVIDQAYFLFEPGTAASEIGGIVKHFSTFRFTIGAGICTFDGLEIEENSQYSRGYDDLEECRLSTWTRGGLPYYLPHKFTRKSLVVPDFHTACGNTTSCVGFHGTNFEAAQHIIRNGFQLPSEGGPCRVHRLHIRPRVSVFGVDDWSEAVFLSPSHKYCMAPHYGGCGSLRTFRSRGARAVFACTGSIPEDKMVFCLMQCRIQTSGLTVNPATDGKVFPGTTPGLNNCDSRVPGTGMEYRVAVPQSVKPYGLLCRFVPETEVREFFRRSDLL